MLLKAKSLWLLPKQPPDKDAPPQNGGGAAERSEAEGAAHVVSGEGADCVAVGDKRIIKI